MADTFANYARSSVAVNTPKLGSNLGWAAADTACALPPLDGGKFPATGNFNLEIGPETGSVFEIAQCTARSGDVLTLTRGAEGTTARDWPVGTPVRLKVTAADYTDLQQDPSNLNFATAIGPVTVAVPATTVATAAKPYHAMVYLLTAGTVTDVTIDATSIGALQTCFFVPAGSVVKVTYSVAPTWQWMVVR
jgi:hypothetical protein